jgi:hypothetical protein
MTKITGPKKAAQIYKLLLIINICIFSLMFYLIPEVRPNFVEEDQFIENFSTILFFGSFILSLIFVVRLAQKTHWWKTYLVIPVLSLICFLDEISFGERIFNLTMPTVYGKKIDAVHDLASVAFKIIRDIILYNCWLCVFVSAAICIIIFSRLRIKELSKGKTWFKKNRIRIASLLVLVAGWIQYAVFGPNLIRAMYEGRSIDILNRTIEFQATYPLEFYFRRADELMFAGSFFYLSLYALYEINIEYRKRFGRIRDIIKKYSPFEFIFISLGFIFVAQLLDISENALPTGISYIIVFVEELLEMNAGLSLLFASLAINKINRANST